MAKRHIGLIGTGIMGAPIAQHILFAGFPLTVWNRSPEKTRELARGGAEIASSCADVLRAADICLCVLSTGQVVDQLLFAAGENGIAPVASLKPGSTLVVMSSIPVAICQAQARHLASRGVDYVDAPVSGGEAGAKAGKLTIMAGGDSAVIGRILDVLETVGSVTRVGGVGMSQLAKLANQMIVGITIGAVAEALLLAKHGGADVGAVRQALCGGFADSTILRAHGKRMQEGNFIAGARTEYQLKDLQTAQQLAVELDLHLPLLSQAEILFDAMCLTELSHMDHSALYLYLERTMTQNLRKIER